MYNHLNEQCLFGIQVGRRASLCFVSLCLSVTVAGRFSVVVLRCLTGSRPGRVRTVYSNEECYGELTAPPDLPPSSGARLGAMLGQDGKTKIAAQAGHSSALFQNEYFQPLACDEFFFCGYLHALESVSEKKLRVIFFQTTGCPIGLLATKNKLSNG